MIPNEPSNHVPLQPPAKSWLLPVVLVSAILLHVALFLSFHEMSLALSSNNTPLKFEDKRIATAVQTDDDIAKKNAQLAHVFNRVITEASGGEAVGTSLALQGSEFVLPDLASLPTEWQPISIDVSMPKQWDVTADLSKTDLLDVPPAIDIVVPSDKLSTLDLLQATEALLGDVEILVNGSFDIHAARGGRNEQASQYGNALENRSGVRQDGLIDPDHAAFASLEGTHAPDSFEQALKDRADKEHQAYEGQIAEGMSQANLGSQSTREGAGSHALNGPGSPGHIASSSDFSLSIEYAPRSHGGGYIFRLALTPKSNVVFKTIKHNISFLIDRSHSIDKERYVATKMAVIEVLDLLREGDTFNLLVFDDHVVSFAPQNVPVNQANIAAAKAFLANQPHGGFFASTDLYASLVNIVPSAVGPQELNTAILLSDGETYLSKDRQRHNISLWTQKNQGKVALFSLAVGKGNNLALLDLLSSLNRGRLAYSPSHHQVGHALRELMSSVEHPIGKDIVTNIVTLHDNGVVSLYPPQQRLPNLYRDTGYVLYGYCSRLEDFYLFLQGRYYDRFLDIKQRVVFREGQQVATADLERQWAIQQAYDLYENYLGEGNHAALAAARRLLSPYGIPIAFQ